MSFLTITPQDTINVLAVNVVHREQEVNQYQINIDNYTQMLSVLPTGQAPDDVAPYVNMESQNIPADVPLDIVMLAADYQYRDRIANLIRSEMIEQSKAKRVLDALKAQIPADQLETLVAEAKLAIDAQALAAASK